MLIRQMTICAAMLLGVTALAANSAQALSSKECSAKYKAAKEAGTLNGMKWNEFRKAQCGADAAAEPAPAAKQRRFRRRGEDSSTAYGGAGRENRFAGQTSVSRPPPRLLRRLEDAESVGKAPEGLNWPQFWHECDVRKKAEGM